jgi:hypothetical protein
MNASRYNHCATTMEVVPVDHPVIREFQQTREVHGVDNAHICNIKTCKFWPSFRVPHTYLCTASLHLHKCKMGCEVAVATTSGMVVCPISGIESHQVYVAYASRQTSRTGVEQFVNSITWKGTGGRLYKKAKPATKYKCTANHVRTLLRSILKTTFAVPSRAALRTQPFQNIMANMFNHTETMRDGPPTLLCTTIAEYVQRVGAKLKPVPNVATFTAVVFDFLGKGLEINNVVIIPQDEWCMARAPKLTAYALVDGLQCRSMSTTTRAFKRAIGKGGNVASLFIWSQVC